MQKSKVKLVQSQCGIFKQFLRRITLVSCIDPCHSHLIIHRSLISQLFKKNVYKTYFLGSSGHLECVYHGASQLLVTLITKRLLCCVGSSEKIH